MSEDARKGRRIILIIVASLLVPSFVVLLLPGSSIRTHALRLGITLAMSFLMWRGYGWARSYMAFSLGLGALLTALSGIIMALAVWWGVVFLLLPPLYAWGAWALWSSPKVEAYIDHCERERNPDMSFTTGS